MLATVLLVAPLKSRELPAHKGTKLFYSSSSFTEHGKKPFRTVLSGSIHIYLKVMALPS